MTYIIIVVAYLVFSGLIANEFYLIACEKGYDSQKYLWYTFFFSIAGMLMVAALPDKNKTSIDFSSNITNEEDSTDSNPTTPTTWKCPKCGRLVDSSYSKCICEIEP